MVFVPPARRGTINAALTALAAAISPAAAPPAESLPAEAPLVVGSLAPAAIVEHTSPSSRSSGFTPSCALAVLPMTGPCGSSTTTHTSSHTTTAPASPPLTAPAVGSRGGPLVVPPASLAKATYEATTAFVATSPAPAPACAVIAVAVDAGSSTESSSPLVVESEGARLLGFEAHLSLILERARVRYCDVSPHAPHTYCGRSVGSLCGIPFVADRHFGRHSAEVLDGVIRHLSSSPSLVPQSTSSLALTRQLRLCRCRPGRLVT